jgi:hypothetical protein
MSTPAQIGKSEYQAALAKGREANRAIRGLLKRLMQESGSNLVQALTGRIALELGDNDEALERLDEIGRNAKKE